MCRAVVVIFHNAADAESQNAPPYHAECVAPKRALFWGNSRLSGVLELRAAHFSVQLEKEARLIPARRR
jgi:hypothetical protein